MRFFSSLVAYGADKMLSEKIYAKVNLSLKVLEKRGNRHTLDMVVASAQDIYDIITVEPRQDNEITFLCSNAELPFDNTATRAAKLIMEEFDAKGVDIEVIKGIPFEAGLGGSSADAAGVINLMKKLFEISDEVRLKQIAARVGSDVQYMRFGGFCRLTSFGEEIERISSERLHAVIVKPRQGVSTSEAFALFDKIGSHLDIDNSLFVRELKCGTINCERFKNDLQQAAALLNSQIAAAIDRLKGCGAAASFMTGSGSAVVGVFEGVDAAKRCQKQLRADSDMYVKYTCLI